jgi:integrase
MGPGCRMSDGVKVEITDDLRYCYDIPNGSGRSRFYVWLGKGHKKFRIHAEPNTAAFVTAYNEALAKARAAVPIQPPEARGSARKIVPGTYRWLCVRYFAESADFKRLDPRTQRIRRSILESTFEEPIAPGAAQLFAEFPLRRLSPKAIRVLRDRKLAKPEAGNGRVKALRQVFAWALEEEIEGVDANHARDVPYFSNDGEGFHTWTVQEVEQFEARHPIGSKARLALALLLFVGVRRSDVVRLGRQMVRDGWLHFTETKGRRHKVKERDVPILPELQAVIDATPVSHMTFLTTEFGAAFTANGFGNWFKKRCMEAGLPHCSAHGLRKAGATIAAENGATEHQLMAMYGWESPKQAAVYTRKANRKKLTGDAMKLIVPIKRNS